MRGRRIDQDALHARLYEESDSNNLKRITQKVLAEEMDLVPETICRVLKRMEDEGRIKRISARKNNVGVYTILSPADWHARRMSLEK